MKLLDGCALHTPVGLRDRAILELLYSTGIRRRELVGLDVEDFSTESSQAVIRRGKGRKDRVVPVGEYAGVFVEAYLKLIRPWQTASSEEPALFVSSTSGGRLHVRTVNGIVAKAARRSGVEKRVSPHTLRHSMATQLLRNRADLRHIQAILGHASLESTEVYTHITVEDLKEVIRRAHPRGKRKRSGGVKWVERYMLYLTVRYSSRWNRLT